MADCFKEEKEKIWQALWSIAEATGMDTGNGEDCDDPRGCQRFFLSCISKDIAAALRAWNQAQSRVGTNDERAGDKEITWKPPIEFVADTMLFGRTHKKDKVSRFKLEDKVAVSIMSGTVGTIVRVPERKSRGFLFGGQYAYDVEFPDQSLQRLAESHLSPVAAESAQAGA